MKTGIIFLGVGALLVLSVLVGGVSWWKWAKGAAAPGNSHVVDFVVPKGQAAGEVGGRLAEVGIIKSGLAFKLALQLSGQTGQIQAGEYRLSPAEDLTGVIKRLLLGPSDIWLTFPEGWRKEQVAARLVANLTLTEEGKQQFLREFFTGAREGYLFPDTYLIPREATAGKVLVIFEENFKRKVEGEELGTRDLDEVMIMAALVERETRVEEERPIVAGILWKRLVAGWPLQADAGLQYARANKECGLGQVECDEWWGQVTVADKELDSPYNTYKNRGLLPGPVASPGLSSIRAATQPAETDYWFYLHDEGGGVHFARTIEEHNANIARYLR